MFFRYLLERKWYILLVAFFNIIYMLTFWLYDIKIDDALYPMNLTGFVLTLSAFVDFYIYKRKNIELENMKNYIDEVIDLMPDTTILFEEKYQELLEILYARKNNDIMSLKQQKKDITEYLTVWTHQIKTPLTALGLMIQRDDIDKGHMLKRIFEVEQYLDMMLQYIRLEGEGNDFVFEEHFVKSMVNQAVKYYARIFIYKKISLNIDIDENIRIVTDEKWLVFVIKQILSNALKYTSENGKISIRCVKDNLNNYDSIDIIIEDNGMGIAAEDLPRIFERGYTGYNGHKDKKSTGIGLYLSKKIMEMLGGEIFIESEIKQGTKTHILTKM